MRGRKNNSLLHPEDFNLLGLILNVKLGVSVCLYIWGTGSIVLIRVAIGSLL